MDNQTPPNALPIMAPAGQPDFAQNILKPVQVSDDVKANAWDIFHGSDGADFETRLAALPLPQDVKATLWDAKNDTLRFSSANPQLAGIGAAKPNVQVQPMFSGLPTGAGSNMQATPAENTPAGHQAAVTQREDTSNLGTIGNAVAQTGIGFAKSGGQTIENTVGKLIPGQAPATAELESNNGWQMTGSALEKMAEYWTGSEALEGLSYTERVQKLMGTMKLLENSPKLRAAAVAGMKASGISFGQELGHGATLGQAATTGAISGGLVGGLTLGANALSAKWLKTGLDQVIEKNKVNPQFGLNAMFDTFKSGLDEAATSNPDKADEFRQLKTLFDNPIGGERLGKINREFVAGQLSSSLKPVSESLKALAGKFGVSTASGFVSALLTDLALRYTPMDASLRHTIDTTMGLTAFAGMGGLKGISPMEVYTNPAAVALRGHLASYLIDNPPLVQAAKSSIAAVISQVASHVSHNYVYNEDTHQAKQTPPAATPVSPVTPVTPAPEDTRLQDLYSGPAGIRRLTNANIALEGNSEVARRNNNPANLIWANQKNAVEGEGGFAKFRTPDEGYNAAIADITRKYEEHPDWTVRQFTHAWSGAQYKGNSAASEAIRNKALLAPLTASE